MDVGPFGGSDRLRGAEWKDLSIGMMDLDLLRTFVAIYERRSLTRAAAVLNVTQPSVSYALARLRRDLHDVLFVRSGQGMTPTARAEDVYAVVRPAIDSIDGVLAESGFDPATARARYRIALTDMGEYAYLPILMERLARSAPGVGVEVVPVDVDAVDRWIARGEIAAAVTSTPPTGRTPWTELFDEAYACVAVWPAASASSPVTAAELGGLRLALIDSASGHDRVGRALEEAGVVPQAVLRVHHFSSLPETLVRSGAAAIVPWRLAEMFARRWPLRARGLGELVEPFQVRLFSNPALHPSPGRRWFVAELEQAVRVFAAETARPPAPL